MMGEARQQHYEGKCAGCALANPEEALSGDDK